MRPCGLSVFLLVIVPVPMYAQQGHFSYASNSVQSERPVRPPHTSPRQDRAARSAGEPVDTVARKAIDPHDRPTKKGYSPARQHSSKAATQVTAAGSCSNGVFVNGSCTVCPGGYHYEPGYGCSTTYDRNLLGWCASQGSLGRAFTADPCITDPDGRACAEQRFRDRRIEELCRQ